MAKAVGAKKELDLVLVKVVIGCRLRTAARRFELEADRMLVLIGKENDWCECYKDLPFSPSG